MSKQWMPGTAMKIARRQERRKGRTPTSQLRPPGLSRSRQSFCKVFQYALCFFPVEFEHHKTTRSRPPADADLLDHLDAVERVS
jgi:hypothetical protein